MIVKTVDAPTKSSIPDESFGDTMFVIDLMRQEKEKKDRLIRVNKDRCRVEMPTFSLGWENPADGPGAEEEEGGGQPLQVLEAVMKTREMGGEG